MDYIFAFLPIIILFGMFLALIIDSWKEFKLKRKIDLLKYMMDKGYETDNVDINKLIEL